MVLVRYSEVSVLYNSVFLVQFVVMGVLEDRLQFAEQSLVAECDADVRYIGPSHIISSDSGARVVRAEPVLFHLLENKEW